MAGTSAAYLVIRKRKARKEVAARVSAIDIETEDGGDIVIRNAQDGNWVATLEDCQLEGDRQQEDVDTKLEYLDVEEGCDGQIVKRIRSVLSGYRAR
jgi:hypothetical protein